MFEETATFVDKKKKSEIIVHNSVTRANLDFKMCSVDYECKIISAAWELSLIDIWNVRHGVLQ